MLFKKKKRIFKDSHKPKYNDTTFNYQLLSRMQSDCEYYLGNGGKCKKHLWASDEKVQIATMKDLYYSVPKKPKWLSMKKIKEYERKMVKNA